jgi:hypothetical protein
MSIVDRFFRYSDEACRVADPAHRRPRVYQPAETVTAMGCKDISRYNLVLAVAGLGSQEITYHVSQADCADYDRKRRANDSPRNVLLSSGS